MGLSTEPAVLVTKKAREMKRFYRIKNLIFTSCIMLMISYFIFFFDSKGEIKEIVISASFKESTGRYFGPYYWAVLGITQFAHQEGLQINNTDVVKLKEENGSSGIYSINDRRIKYITMEPVPHIRIIFTDEEPITTMIDIELQNEDEKGMIVTSRVRKTEDKNDCGICKRFEEVMIKNPEYPSPKFILSSPVLLTN